jgi:hypothetical protein
LENATTPGNRSPETRKSPKLGGGPI